MDGGRRNQARLMFMDGRMIWDMVSRIPPYMYTISMQPCYIFLGMDHERLTYRFQGRKFRLTDVHGHVVKDVLT